MTVIHFSPDIFGSALGKTGELSHIRKLLALSDRGIRFDKSLTSENENALNKISMAKYKDRFLQFMMLMDLLTQSSNFTLLSSMPLRVGGNDDSVDRIDHIYSYILDHYDEDISLSEVASDINMTGSAFSHFIKKRTGKTFSQLINDLRIKYACKLLSETDLNISEICFKTGYRNLSYFNRQFRSINNCSPLEFRKIYKKEYLDSYARHPELKKLDANRYNYTSASISN